MAEKPVESPEPEAIAPIRRRRWGRRLVMLLVLAGGVIVGDVGWRAMYHSGEPDPRPAAAQQPPPQQQPPPVPVLTALTRVGDVPIFLTGIGTVQASNTVTVKVRVDGQLQAVNFTEGQEVHKGDVIAQIDPAPFQAQLAQVQATKARDEAQLANARADLERFIGLRDYATRQSVDTQKALVAQLEAAVRLDQAQIDYATVQLNYTTIHAPIDGRTGVRLVDEGNIVHASDQTGLVVITQLEPISANFTLPEDTLDQVRRAMDNGTLKVFAFARGGGQPRAEGSLLLVDNQIDQTTGTIRLKASFPNKDRALWPGQFVEVRLMTEIRHNGVTVPSSVVQRGPNGAYAYVVRPDRTVEMRPITVAELRNNVALIDKGLGAGDEVVVDGQYKLRPGARVSTQPAKVPGFDGLPAQAANSEARP